MHAGAVCQMNKRASVAFHSMLIVHIYIYIVCFIVIIIALHCLGCVIPFFPSPLSIRSFVPHLLLLSSTSPRHPLSWMYCIAMISICATVQIQMVGHCLYRDSEPYFMGFDLQCANFIYSAAWIWRGKKSAAKQKQQSKIADCDWR